MKLKNKLEYNRKSDLFYFNYVLATFENRKWLSDNWAQQRWNVFTNFQYSTLAELQVAIWKWDVNLLYYFPYFIRL